MAVPAYNTPITHVKGYLLDLFVNSEEGVAEKIVEPLLHSGEEGRRLDVAQVAFPGAGSSHSTLAS